ncbi:MAG: hypothetical protein L6Q81_12850 [Bacteroidia bacterium]|nr:hypothetical protein [Bacteroidia bacterium]
MSSKNALQTLIDKYDGVVFHDGCNELMIRIPESGEYMAFDEHGLVFIYTQADYSNDLARYEIKYKPKEKLIYEFDHWHYRPGNAKEDLACFISDLGLH